MTQGSEPSRSLKRKLELEDNFGPTPTLNSKRTAISKSENIYYSVFGKDIKPTINHINKEKSLTLNQLQNILLWTSGAPDGMNPSQVITFQNSTLIKKVVLVLLDGLNSTNYHLYNPDFPTLASFPVCCGLTTVYSEYHVGSVPDFLFRFNRSHKKNAIVTTKKSHQDRKEDSKTTNTVQDQITCPTTLILSESQLIENKYPTSDHQTKGYLTTHSFISQTDSNSAEPTVLALDCEMCITSQGFELTRISVVDDSLNVLLDTFVMPPNKIIDYNTRYSGITAEILDGVTTTLSDVQAHLKTLISRDTILIGHSLENDLHALRMVHDRVIDTAVVFPRGQDKKHSLKTLARMILNERIQDNEHDSIEDARTAMKLISFRLLNKEIEKEQYPSLFDSIGSSVAIGTSRVMSTINLGNCESIIEEDEEDVAKKAVRVINEDKHKFVCVGFREFTKCRTGFPYLEKEMAPQDIREIAKKTDERISKIVEAVPVNSLVITAFTHPGFRREDFRHYLAQTKSTWDNAQANFESKKWSSLCLDTTHVSCFFLVKEQDPVPSTP